MAAYQPPIGQWTNKWPSVGLHYVRNYEGGGLKVLLLYWGAAAVSLVLKPVELQLYDGKEEQLLTLY